MPNTKLTFLKIFLPCLITVLAVLTLFSDNTALSLQSEIMIKNQQVLRSYFDYEDSRGKSMTAQFAYIHYEISHVPPEVLCDEGTHFDENSIKQMQATCEDFRNKKISYQAFSDFSQKFFLEQTAIFSQKLDKSIDEKQRVEDQLSSSYLVRWNSAFHVILLALTLLLQPLLLIKTDPRQPA